MGSQVAAIQQAKAACSSTTKYHIGGAGQGACLHEVLVRAGLLLPLRLILGSLLRPSLLLNLRLLRQAYALVKPALGIATLLGMAIMLLMVIDHPCGCDHL